MDREELTLYTPSASVGAITLMGYSLQEWVLITWSSHIIHKSTIAFNPFGSNAVIATPLPCRVKVYKLARVVV